MPETPVRDFSTFFKPGQLDAYHRGTMNYQYRGIPCLKSPIDLAIYLRLIWDAKPRTIFEIGSKAGGSALFFRDAMRSFGLDGSIVSIDLDPPHLPSDQILFCKGDVHNLTVPVQENNLHSRPRPWMVLEDSAHTFTACQAALHFFAKNLQIGEYLVIEDGVLDDLGWSERYDGGPNRAIAKFLKEQPSTFEITGYCDMFGRNATFNPNGYLRKL